MRGIPSLSLSLSLFLSLSLSLSPFFLSVHLTLLIGEGPPEGVRSWVFLKDFRRGRLSLSLSRCLSLGWTSQTVPLPYVYIYIHIYIYIYICIYIVYISCRHAARMSWFTLAGRSALSTPEEGRTLTWFTRIGDPILDPPKK